MHTASQSSTINPTAPRVADVHCHRHLHPASPLNFHKVTQEAMAEIWPLLRQAVGRTTDFSYGGLLMWVDFFNYEYCIVDGTLFIKGVVESDRRIPAFSLPVGAMPLEKSIALLKDYCRGHGIRLELSAVPEEAVDSLMRCGAIRTEELSDWGDYLYDSIQLAELKGKKMGKKRNHVNQFMASYPDWKYEPLDSDNVSEAMAFMDRFDLEGDDTPMAAAERQLTRRLIELFEKGDPQLLGGLLRADGEVCAFTIGDIKGDTLFVHVEKATRQVAGSYETINKLFAADIVGRHPEIAYINREDNAGDEGLRLAKESYHPTAILKKYNVVF